MSSQRRSDENSNPENELDLNASSTEVKLEAKNKPLFQSNESSGKRKLSAFERKEKVRLTRSGMKRGSLLKYFVKDNSEEIEMQMHESVSTSKRRTSSACNNVNLDTEQELLNTNQPNIQNARLNNQILNSEIHGLGPMNRRSTAETVDFPSDSEMEPEGDSESPRVSDYDVEDDDPASSGFQADVTLHTISNLRQLSSQDKIEQWQRQNKRMLQDIGHERVSSSLNCSHLQPPPSKASKLELESRSMIDEGLSIEDVTPEKSQDSNTSAPTIRIVNVYTLANGENNDTAASPSISCAQSSNSTLESVGKASKSIFIYKEFNNSNLNSLIEKKNWRKVLEMIRKDLDNYKLPAKSFVGQLVRKAILCEGARVSKDVQSDSIKLLEELISRYPPHTGNGGDTSVKYYKEVFEKVLEEGNKSLRTNGSTLFILLDTLSKRLDEKNVLHILVLITKLVEEQYNVYVEETGVKVKPPLFQYFLEEKEGAFSYNQHCEAIVNKCFNALSDEEFCLHLKWVDLISRRLRKLSIQQKDYKRMINDFVKHCTIQHDQGLLVLMNLKYKPFPSDVCLEMFQKLKVVLSKGDENEEISDTERHSYLLKVSKTLLIKPSGDIVADVIEECCQADSSLTFAITRADVSKNNQQNFENELKGRRKNVKGETRLHILCRPDQDNPVADVIKHLKSHPEDVNARDNFGNTPLHDCARNDKGNIILALMKLHEAKKLDSIDFLARNESWETPMHLAATYCAPQTLEILIYFATRCGVLDKVLTSANGLGKLPFQLVTAKCAAAIKKKLTPKGYDISSMLIQEGLTLDRRSIDMLENSFELRKILAWWSQNCQ